MLNPRTFQYLDCTLDQKLDTSGARNRVELQQAPASMRPRLRSLLLAAFLLPLFSEAKFCSFWLRLFSEHNSVTLLGSGSSGYSDLYSYKTPDGNIIYRKLKKYNDRFGDVDADVKDANHLASVMAKHPKIKVAKHKKIRNPFNRFDAEIEYYPGMTLKQKMESLKVLNDERALEALKQDYARVSESILRSAIEDPSVISLEFEDSVYELPKDPNLRKDFVLSEKMRYGIENGSLSFYITRKSLGRTVSHWYYLKADNFVYTPNNEFVLIDPH